MAWVIGYDNDTGSNDGYFIEWWEVTNGEKTFKAESEEDAIWLHGLITKEEKDNG